MTSPDPFQNLDAQTLAQRLGLSGAEAVLERFQAGELLCSQRQQGASGLLFPAYQAMDGVAGAPMKQILDVLRNAGPTIPQDIFFSSQNRDLGWLTPEWVLAAAEIEVQIAVAW